MPLPLLIPAAAGITIAGLRAMLMGLIRYVITNLPAIFVNFLLALGFYFVVAKPATDFGIDWIINQFNGVPGTVLETLYYLNMDDWIQIVFSAYAARKTLDAGRIALKKRPAAAA